MGMWTSEACVILPVENQVRELDPKLLLACVAARRGLTVIIGSHREIDLRIASFPRSLYLNKSMTDRNLKMFRIMRDLGHEILTWDEEALVHLPPEIYYSRRLSPEAIKFVTHLFAWGENNAALWRDYSHLPAGMPIHVTGNPRSDMLRPELRHFYEPEAERLRRKYSRIILVNTNFNHVNAFSAAQNLFLPQKRAGGAPGFGKAGVGMSRAYAEGLRDHKQAILDAFLRMIPVLDEAFPDHTIVVRPHPTESQKIYEEIAASRKRVVVTNEGNVVPWLMASDAVIHNGCTTGVEAYVMGVPSISYRARVDEGYDLGFYRLPNLISHQCFDVDQLRKMLGRLLQGKLGAADGDERVQLLKGHLAADDRSLACERIVAVLEGIVKARPKLPKPALDRRFAGWTAANWRRFNRRVRKYFPGKHAPEEFHRHRYPGISLTDVNARILRLQRAINDSSPIKTSQISKQIFLVGPG